MRIARGPSPAFRFRNQSTTTHRGGLIADVTSADPEAVADRLRATVDRAFLGFDPAPGPDRSVAFAPWSPERTIELPLLDVPRRPTVHVVPDAWLPGPLALPDGSFVARHSDGRRLERLPDIDSPLLGRFSAMDLRWIDAPPSPRRRKSKGWRRHIRRAKAARRRA